MRGPSLVVTSLPNFPGQSQVTEKTLEELRKDISDGVKSHFLWYRVLKDEDEAKRLLQLINMTRVRSAKEGLHLSSRRRGHNRPRHRGREDDHAVE